MKHFTFILIVLLACTACSGTTTNTENRMEANVPEAVTPVSGVEYIPDTDSIYNMVDEIPQYPDGEMGLMKFINQNMKYPVEAKEKKIEGRVVLTFVIEKDGSISNIEVVRGIDPLLDNEALRVARQFPNWEPGKLKGETVRVKYTLPVVFRLQ